jgi:hypothetical protein
MGIRSDTAVLGRRLRGAGAGLGAWAPARVELRWLVRRPAVWLSGAMILLALPATTYSEAWLGLGETARVRAGAASAAA